MLDFLAEDFRIAWEGEKFRGVWARGTVLDENCFLLKPMTFMNLSGRSVAEVARFYKIPVRDIVVFHDDVDVPAGRVRARVGGSDGGHKGIRSMIEEIGSADFHRVKLGVGRPGVEQAERETTDWVLGRMNDEELKALDEVMFPEAVQRLRGIFGMERASAAKSSVVD